MPERSGRLGRARAVTLALWGAATLASVGMAAVGLPFERRRMWVVLGAVGLLALLVALAGSLYAMVRPGLPEATRRGIRAGLVAAAVGSVPLAAPVGADRWHTWAWIGAAIAGSALPILRPAAAVLAMTATTVVSGVVAWWTGGSIVGYVVITMGAGLAVATLAWLWRMLGRLEATERRLRVARDVQDVLGHSLLVIAMKAELAARLAPTDAERSANEATDVQRLAGSALAVVRRRAHGPARASGTPS